MCESNSEVISSCAAVVESRDSVAVYEDIYSPIVSPASESAESSELDMDTIAMSIPVLMSSQVTPPPERCSISVSPTPQPLVSADRFSRPIPTVSSAHKCCVFRSSPRKSERR